VNDRLKVEIAKLCLFPSGWTKDIKYEAWLFFSCT